MKNERNNSGIKKV